MIHYRSDQGDPSSLVAEAEKTFPGQVVLARDFMEIDYEEGVTTR
jgi:ribonuclease BN (tRNA processing enzyme)